MKYAIQFLPGAIAPIAVEVDDERGWNTPKEALDGAAWIASNHELVCCGEELQYLEMAATVAAGRGVPRWVKAINAVRDMIAHDMNR